MSQLPATPATTPALLPLEVRLHRQGRPLRELNRQEEAGLRLRLLALAKLLGLSNVPDDHQLGALSEFLRRNFGEFTEAELGHALERWAAGELAPEERPFGTLSLDFLGRVLAAARRTRQEATRRAAQLEAAARRQGEEPPPPSPEYDERHHQLIAAHVAAHGELPPLADWTACWRHLHRTGQLPTLDPAGREAVLAALRSNYAQERERARLTGRPRPWEPSTEEELHREARAYRARAYYQNLLDELNPPNL